MTYIGYKDPRQVGRALIATIVADDGSEIHRLVAAGREDDTIVYAGQVLTLVEAAKPAKSAQQKRREVRKKWKRRKRMKKPTSMKRYLGYTVAKAELKSKGGKRYKAMIFYKAKGQIRMEVAYVDSMTPKLFRSVKDSKGKALRKVRVPKLSPKKAAALQAKMGKKGAKGDKSGAGDKASRDRAQRDVRAHAEHLTASLNSTVSKLDNVRQQAVSRGWACQMPVDAVPPMLTVNAEGVQFDVFRTEGLYRIERGKGMDPGLVLTADEAIRWIEQRLGSSLRTVMIRTRETRQVMTASPAEVLAAKGESGGEMATVDGKTGVWRTVGRSKARVFYPDDGSEPIGMPKALRGKGKGKGKGKAGSKAADRMKKFVADASRGHGKPKTRMSREESEAARKRRWEAAATQPKGKGKSKSRVSASLASGSIRPTDVQRAIRKCKTCSAQELLDRLGLQKMTQVVVDSLVGLYEAGRIDLSVSDREFAGDNHMLDTLEREFTRIDPGAIQITHMGGDLARFKFALVGKGKGRGKGKGKSRLVSASVDSIRDALGPLARNVTLVDHGRTFNRSFDVYEIFSRAQPKLRATFGQCPGGYCFYDTTGVRVRRVGPVFQSAEDMAAAALAKVGQG